MSDGTKDVEFITPPDDLTRKAPVSPMGVDADAIAKAEAMIAGLQDDYLAWAEDDVGKLVRACEDLINDPPDLEAARDAVFQLAHDMKGQGGSFGYDLVTIVGDQLCRLVEGLTDTPTHSEAEVLRVHVKTIRLILSQRMKGDGGREGTLLLDGLQKAMDKVSG